MQPVCGSDGSGGLPKLTVARGVATRADANGFKEAEPFTELPRAIAFENAVNCR